MGTAAETRQVIEELHQALEDTTGRMTAAVATLAGLSLNSVLLTERFLHLGPTEGHIHRQFHVPYASVGLWAYESDVIVSSGPLQADTPVVGRGLFKVPQSRFAVFPLTGREITLFGAPGALTLLMVWSSPQIPSVGGTSGVNGGTP